MVLARRLLSAYLYLRNFLLALCIRWSRRRFSHLDLFCLTIGSNAFSSSMTPISEMGILHSKGHSPFLVWALSTTKF